MTLVEECKNKFTISERMARECDERPSSALVCYIDGARSLKKSGNPTAADNVDKLVHKIQTASEKELRELLTTLLNCLKSAVQS